MKSTVVAVSFLMATFSAMAAAVALKEQAVPALAESCYLVDSQGTKVVSDTGIPVTLGHCVK